ncbi:MAG: hypothetical protein WA738_07950 [Candidatus Angelobacter sp.]
MSYGKAVRLLFVMAPLLAAAQQPLQSRAVPPQPIQPAVASLSPGSPQLAPLAPLVAAGVPGSTMSHDSSAAVDYVSGRLTLVSDSAPLGYVLKLIARKTGAVVDLAPELQNEPVVARLGPGPVREVLTSLLDSPRIDYIVLGTGDEPGSLKRIVVRARHSGVTMANIRAAQARQGATNDEQNGDPNDSPDAQLTQQQLMENWKKVREEKLQAEIQQQAHDRENERNQPSQPPIPENPPQETQANPPQQ